jgi:uncharacterized protein (TIGR03118 family)
VTRRPILHPALVAAAALALLAGTATAYADVPPPRFMQVNQVSDTGGPAAALTDDNAVNSWGLALSPTSPLWVANNGTNTATLYAGGVGGVPVTKVGLTVTIPGGAPTGQVFNGDANSFIVTGPNGSGAARFIFDSEEGEITGWSPAAAPTTAIVAAKVDGAIYKGLALLVTNAGPMLLAADFHNARIDVFDSSFDQVNLPASAFHDPGLPTGYAPFNVAVLAGSVYVAYAKQDAEAEDETAGPALGFVDRYATDGQLIERIASHGTLNAPWGLAIAPASFGPFAGDLLVGNFGDGRINVFHGTEFLGQLRDQNNHKITIDGLWALLPGTASTGGTGTVWFSAGPDEESHGLVGQLIPTS